MTYDMRIRTDFGKYLLGDGNYFGLTNSGMGRYLDAMYDLQMLHDSDSPMKKGDWPKWDETLDEEEAELKYAIELEHKTIRHGINGNGEKTIPTHKFGSNDRWIITPDEIEAALEEYEKYTEEQVNQIVAWSKINPRDNWYVWIEFLRKAKNHAGFRVM